MVVEITAEKIAVTDAGEPLDYPSGRIATIEPGVMSLRLSGGIEEKFRFIRSGDILELGFERAGLSLAKAGSDTDRLYERLEREAELQDGTDQRRLDLALLKAGVHPYLTSPCVPEILRRWNCTHPETRYDRSRQ